MIIFKSKQMAANGCLQYQLMSMTIDSLYVHMLATLEHAGRLCTALYTRSSSLADHVCRLCMAQGWLVGHLHKHQLGEAWEGGASKPAASAAVLHRFSAKPNSDSTN